MEEIKRSYEDQLHTHSFDDEGAKRYFQFLMQKAYEMGITINSRESLKLFLDRYFNIVYYNAPNLSTNNYILAPNHVSDLDGLIMGLFGSDTLIVAKEGWVNNEGVMNYLNSIYKFIGINRNDTSDGYRVIQECKKFLNEKTPRSLLIFPQGTISNIDFNTFERVELGVFTIAARSHVPIIPIHIEQVNEEKKTRIIFGNPYYVGDGDGRIKKQEREHIATRWIEEVRDLPKQYKLDIRKPLLSEKHSNNNKPGDKYY